MVVPVVVYQEEGKNNKFSICHDSEEDDYFIMVGQEIYHEFNYPFRGEFAEAKAKLKELIASEHLVIVAPPEGDSGS